MVGTGSKDVNGTYRCEIRTTVQTLTAESHIIHLPGELTHDHFYSLPSSGVKP